MPVLERRLQILIDHDRYERLESVAASDGRSVAAVVRDAIDHHLVDDQARRTAAGTRILARTLPDGPPLDWAQIKQELEDEFIPHLD